MTEQEYSRLFEFYRPIWEAIEDIGWKVERNGNEVTLGNYSPAGEELYKTLYLDAEKDIPKQLYELYDSFDEEEHITMWVNAKQNGVAGVPSIQRLVHDAEDITEMYEQLFCIAQEKYSLCKEAK